MPLHVPEWFGAHHLLQHLPHICEALEMHHLPLYELARLILSIVYRTCKALLKGSVGHLGSSPIAQGIFGDAIGLSDQAALLGNRAEADPHVRWGVLGDVALEGLQDSCRVLVGHQTAHDFGDGLGRDHSANSCPVVAPAHSHYFQRRSQPPAIVAHPSSYASPISNSASPLKGTSDVHHEM